MTLAKLASGEVAPPSVAKPPLETDEKISGENFSPEKQSPDFSPVSIVRLNELINVSDSSTPPSRGTQKHEPSPEERAEALYRLVRPGHLTLPNSEQRTVALRVLGMYLQRYDSPQVGSASLEAIRCRSRRARDPSHQFVLAVRMGGGGTNPQTAQ
jgi:hypothetical protein